MATATLEKRSAGQEARGVKATSEPTPVVSAAFDRRGEYRCECGHELRVFGGGRHRVYFEPSNTRLDDPVMNRVCPECGRGLRGKNAP
jgi:hypothetical protein